MEMSNLTLGRGLPRPSEPIVTIANWSSTGQLLDTQGMQGAEPNTLVPEPTNTITSCDECVSAWPQAALRVVNAPFKLLNHPTLSAILFRI